MTLKETHKAILDFFKELRLKGILLDREENGLGFQTIGKAKFYLSNSEMSFDSEEFYGLVSIEFNNVEVQVGGSEVRTNFTLNEKTEDSTGFSIADFLRDVRKEVEGTKTVIEIDGKKYRLIEN